MCARYCSSGFRNMITCWILIPRLTASFQISSERPVTTRVASSENFASPSTRKNPTNPPINISEILPSEGNRIQPKKKLDNFSKKFSAIDPI